MKFKFLTLRLALKVVQLIFIIKKLLGHYYVQTLTTIYNLFKNLF